MGSLYTLKHVDEITALHLKEVFTYQRDDQPVELNHAGLHNQR